MRVFFLLAGKRLEKSGRGAGRRLAATLSLLALLAGLPARADELTPRQSLEKLTPAKGFEISLFAAEPLVAQPVAMTFDDRGRMWVVQYLQYPTPAGLKAVKEDEYLRTKWDRVPEPPPHGPKGADIVAILEDTDGDGLPDKSKHFIEGLNLASGLAIGREGVYVIQTPYLLFYPDRNHDDVPDSDPEVLLTGFGMEDAHAVANSLTWGPDGWLYGAQGSTVTANIRGVEFQQGIWRYHPDTKAFELFAEGGGNTWGIDLDADGNLFASGNTAEPLCHHVQGAYYVKGFGKHGPLHNPYSFGYFPPVKHNGYLGNGLSGGAVIYQGDYFPQEFHGVVIYPHGRQSAMRWSRLERTGSTFETHYVGDFITSADRSFRPVDCAVGPDGALYVADWCDDNISHTNPLDRSQWYRPRRDDGRIWKVTVKGQAPPPFPARPLSELPSGELVELLSHRNDWYVRESRRILSERRDRSTGPALGKLLAGDNDGLALQALWTLHSSGLLDDGLAVSLLSHRSEFVRSWTVRLLGDAGNVSAAAATAMARLAANDSSVMVRSQLACTAKRLPGPEALAIVDRLTLRDEDQSDKHMPLLIWWAVEAKAVSDAPAVLSWVAVPDVWRRPLVRDVLIERLAQRYAGAGGELGFGACARLLAAAPDEAEGQRVLAAIDRQLAGRPLGEPPVALVEVVSRRLADNPNAFTLRLALRLGSREARPPALRAISDAQAPEADRVALLQAIAEGASADDLPVLLARLQEEPVAGVRSAVLSALGRYADDRVAETVLAMYGELPVDLRARAVDLLASRTNSAKALLTAVGGEKIAATDITLDQVRRLRLHDDAELQSTVEKRWGKVRAATPLEKRGKIMAITQMLNQGEGNPENGKALFKKHCATCHKLDGEGTVIGPDLAATDRKNLDVLLMNVVDPNSVIRPEFMAYIVNTTDGRALRGLLADQTPEKIVLLDDKNQRTILAREEIDEMAPADHSLMPDKIVDPLTPQEVRDLFGYIRLDRAKKE